MVYKIMIKKHRLIIQMISLQKFEKHFLNKRLKPLRKATSNSKCSYEMITWKRFNNIFII